MGSDLEFGPFPGGPMLSAQRAVPYNRSLIKDLNFLTTFNEDLYLSESSLKTLKIS